MRVVHVIGAYVPAHAYGGVVVATHELVKAQRRAGARVLVLTTDANGSARVEAGVRELDGIEVRYRRADPLNRYGASLGLVADIARTVRSYDVVHCHGTAQVSTTVSLWAGLLAGRALALSPHGSLMAWARRRKAWRKRASALLDAIPARRALVHANSIEEGRDATAAGFSHVCVVPNGVDVAAMQVPAAVDLRSRLGIAPRATVVAWLGRFDVVKNLEVLLDATAPMAVDVVLAGDAATAYGEHVRKLAKGPRAGRVHFLGHADDETKRALLQQADVYAHPSHLESYGMSIAEAVACGCPVVASTGTPWSELERAGAGRWVAADAGAFRSAILDLLGRERRAIRASALEVASRHCWDERARRILAEYEAHARRSRRAVNA
jgi:glycosyltransferase involved in cell wall biosynthesis